MEPESTTTWDYLTLTCRVYPPNIPHRRYPYFKVISVNGSEPEKSREVEVWFFGNKTEKDHPILEEVLQGLGKNGWELCASHAFQADFDFIQIILKRPHSQ